ncbi:MAG TPA: hypothetical protein VGP84_00705 [Gemmatimonadaceae bacterium]|jgi:hypothetical protein|nr:hypothetical protein [Gemmatimonadaceae bacterium]
MTNQLRPLVRATFLVLTVVACATGEDDQFVRGHRLRVASLQPNTRVSVYRSALGAAFELNDPALTLLLDRRVLSRAGGMEEEGRLPGPVEVGLRDRGVIQGTCEPPITTSRKTPQCVARGPGYVVRFSDIFRRGGDSVEVYLAVQKFDTPTNGGSESLRFERAYQLVHRAGDKWEPTREARVRETTLPPGVPKS